MRKEFTMRIALINENSQAAKNELICTVLEKVVVPMGHTVDNYGMYRADDEAQLTYVQAGILGAILLNSGAADYVITGCGTGEGAMLAMNSSLAAAYERSITLPRVNGPRSMTLTTVHLSLTRFVTFSIVPKG